MHSFSPSCGASGGIIAIRDLDSISHTRVLIHDWNVAIPAVWVHLGLKVVFIVVYASQGLNNKRLL